ncbi:D-alanine--D-alanine ligase [Candidatus Saccharibacteria bacterium CPR2]|nr:D-alanine--D-alanine ligase [Candidatus Saccharibacteria bacterium CPR2]
MKNVAVIFGGRSTEHDVSIVTALSSIIAPIEMLSGYKPIPVYIARDGSWYTGDDLKEVHFYSGGNLEDKLKKMKKLSLKFDDGLWLLKPGLGGEKIRVDIVFPSMHGTYGEDGSLMGLLRMAGVPFVGCDMAASVIAMDKVLTKQLVSDAGLAVTKYVWFEKRDWQKNSKEIITKINNLKYPLFVKPAHLGSSIAITKVKTKDELENALEVAMHYDDKILVEEGVTNLTEVTVPVMGNDKPRVGMVEESLAKAEFFDFESKYMNGGKKIKGFGKDEGGDKSTWSRIPAKIPKPLYKECENLALATYKVLGCSGISRVDLLIDSGKKIYVNEVNTLPGTLYRHNWQKAGVSAVELVEKLLHFAIERFEESKRLTTVFNTNFLKQF